MALLDAAPEEAQFDDFHIEALRVRTVRRNWTIPAHVHHGLHQVFAIERGGVRAVVDGEQLTARGPAILLAPSAAPHAFRFAEGSTGRVLTLRHIRTFLDRKEPAARLERLLFAHSAILAFSASSAEWRDLLRLLTVLEHERIRRREGPIDTANHLLTAILGVLARRAEQRRLETTHQGAPHAALFAAFENLVDETLLQHLSSSSYAGRLGVSISTLDRICRNHAGSSPARYVRNRLYLEARRRLAYSDAAIQHIADDLGFADVGYFSRFVSRHSTLSPSGLRRQLRGRGEG
ncbi:MAG: helix-turn-helix domain-containing protein [Hyphomonadaceae bacterium]|nr:helix-turn-helix domain-containing protein [Hyphomonadaceae bacterium]